MIHYYILCLFAKGQTKNLKGLRSKNKKLEGFAKQKQKTWRVYEAKTICHICDATRIATCGAPPIANL
jgi:hypothetical protein